MKIQCQDCGEIRNISRRTMSRRNKPRCFRCGCTRLDPVNRDHEIERLDGLRFGHVPMIRTI